MESEKVGLKLNIQKMKIMASSPITSWEIDVGKADKATIDGNISREREISRKNEKEVLDQQNCDRNEECL